MKNKIHTRLKLGGNVEEKLGGGLLDIAQTAAPYVMSGINTLFNRKQVSNLRTNRKPILANPALSNYKSNLPDIVDVNEAAYQGFTNSPNTGIGATGRQGAFSSLLNANTKAGLADTQGRNTFNANRDRLSSMISRYNSAISNQTAEGNLQRGNDKIIADTQAVNAGVQDLINIDTNRRVGNSQDKSMMLQFLKDADTGVLGRVAGQFGASSEDFIGMLTNPNMTFRDLQRIGKRKRRKAVVEEPVYDPVLGETGD